MGWWNRRPAAMQNGSVLYRGSWVPRPEEFRWLESHGVRRGTVERRSEGGWSLPLEHPSWGRATLVFLPDAPLPPGLLVDMEPRLNDDERAAVKSCGWSIGIAVEARSGNVLADRKDLLRFLHAALGEAGVAGCDHTAGAMWSRRGLQDELAHDADLDIDAIYTMHLVHDDEGGAKAPGTWLHSHGLSEIGFWDFDILDPGPDVPEQGHDVLRALAFMVVEGALTPGGGPVELLAGEHVRAIAARDFLAATGPSGHGDYRASVDDAHLDGHAVICDRAPGGLITRLLRGDQPRPASFFRRPLPDEVLIHFSSSATELMAERARRTLDVFREQAADLAEFSFPALAKLGYPVDGGDGDHREHLWFEVHGFAGDAIDATLLNRPFHIARLHAGERGLHPLELLSDWAILTPFGTIDPRQTRTLRFVRENREQVREAVAAAQAQATGA